MHFVFNVDCRTRGAPFLESNVTGTTGAVAPGFVSLVCARHERTIIMDAAPSDATGKAQRIEVTSPPGAGEAGRIGDVAGDMKMARAALAFSLRSFFIMTVFDDIVAIRADCTATIPDPGKHLLCHPRSGI